MYALKTAGTDVASSHCHWHVHQITLRVCS